MATTITAGNATNGAAISSDNTGILELKTGTGSGTTAVTIGTNQSVTFAGAVTSSGNQTVTGNLTVNGNTTLGDANTDTILMTAAPSIGGAGLGMGFGFRNRIINGGMVIDQRNAGASVTYSSNPGYPVDRTRFEFSQVSKITGQRSTTAPAGFSNSAQGTVAAAVTPGASDYFLIGQGIEGLNVADLGWGTISAQTVTLSFWVRSSVTGTYSLRFINGSFNRTYLTSYTISAANTWEQKTITLAGDTSGTWATDNTAGIVVQWDLGAGSNATSSTTNAWQAGNYQHVTGSVNWISNAGATFYITGVQLEEGVVSTNFDYRPYGTELALCQRYLPAWNTSAVNAPFAIGQAVSTTLANVILPFQTQPRVPPTGITATAASSFYLVNANNGLAGTYSSTTFAYASLNSMHIICTTSGGLASGNATYLGTNTPPAQILATGCEL